MLFLAVIPADDGSSERVHIVRFQGEFCLDLASRRSASEWLARHGCGPAAVGIVADALPAAVYQLEEPGDPGFLAPGERPVGPVSLPPKA